MSIKYKELLDSFVKPGRLIDVFITGPLQIYVSTFLKHLFLRYFMLLTGILNIIYNGHNFLLFNNLIKNPLPILKKFIHLEHGKYQIHRLYNLIIMYPVFLYVLINTKLSFITQILFFINITIGFLFNLFYFVFYYNNK